MNRILLFVLGLLFIIQSNGQSIRKSRQANDISVIGYYAGSTTALDSFEIEKLTHIIFCFCHLRGDSLSLSRFTDTTTIQKMVSLKSKSPGLKVILSLGGWGGCKDCSSIFSTKKGRRKFSKSAKELLDYFNADGIDLDWEYPAIEGYPGHSYNPNDRENFTALVKKLRHVLGKKKEISFAAGGFNEYLEKSVEWDKVMPKINRVNLMSYDLISGFSKVTGHHTALYSTSKQKQSTDNAVKYLDSIGVPLNKITIGAAFYARIFEASDSSFDGLNQPAVFKNGLSYKNFDTTFTREKGFEYYWDSIAKASYYYNHEKKLFASFDDSASIKLKTRYVIDKRLNGIMFWQLRDDKFQGGLLDIIYRIVQDEKRKRNQY